MAETSNCVLRLLASVKAEAEKPAAEESTPLDRFINVAMAEKVAALRAGKCFRERAGRADLAAFDRFLAEAADESPHEGDEADSGGP